MNPPIINLNECKCVNYLSYFWSNYWGRILRAPARLANANRYAVNLLNVTFHRSGSWVPLIWQYLHLGYSRVLPDGGQTLVH